MSDVVVLISFLTFIKIFLTSIISRLCGCFDCGNICCESRKHLTIHMFPLRKYPFLSSTQSFLLFNLYVSSSKSFCVFPPNAYITLPSQPTSQSVLPSPLPLSPSSSLLLVTAQATPRTSGSPVLPPNPQPAPSRPAPPQLA